MDFEEKIEKDAINNRCLYRAQIELTSNCNWRCRHCYIENYSRKGIEKNKLFNVLQELKEMGVFELIITGGEVFYRQDAMEIIEFARKLGFKVIVFSNISMLDDKKIYKLKELNVSMVSCTIFSLDSKIHDYITQVPGSLEKCLNNLHLLKVSGIDVEVKTIVTNININDVALVEEYCSVNKFQFRIDYEIFTKTNGDKAPLDYRLSEKDFLRHGAKLDNIRKFSITSHEDEEYACEQIRCYIFIDANGDVYPCEKFRYKVGNIYNQSISEIWNNPDLSRIHNIKWKELSSCISCKYSEYCQRCPGSAYMEMHDEYGIYEGACERARNRFEMKEIV